MAVRDVLPLRALALLALVVGSCGPAERDPNVIEFWTLQLSPTFDDYIRGLVRDYEAAHPGVTVRWVDVPYEGITQKFLNAIAAGQAPDVVNLPADYVLKYAKLGALAPLDPLLADSARAAYLPAAVAPLVVGGATYAVPWYLSTQVVLYDRAKLAAAGYDSTEVPQTYDALLRFARDYHARTGQYGLFFNLVTESDLVLVLRAEGVPVVSADGRRALFARPEAVRVLEDWRRTFAAGALPRESITQGHAAALKLYQSGTVALFVGGPQFLRIIRENAPGLYATTEVAPAVTGASGARNLAVMSLAVAKRSANAALAADFAAFVTNGPNQLAFAKIVPVYPSVTAALADPYFREADATLEARARVIGAAQLAGAEVLKPSLDHYNRLQEALKVQLLRAFKDGKPLPAALADAAESWDKILAEGP